jgi:hypothetical protein
MQLILSIFGLHAFIIPIKTVVVAVKTIVVAVVILKAFIPPELARRQQLAALAPAAR